VKSTYLLSDEERTKSTNALLTWLDIPNDPTIAQKLRDILNQSFPGCEPTYVSLKLNDVNANAELDDDRIPRFVVDILGVELLEGIHGKKLRGMMLDKIFQKNPNIIRRLHMKKINAEDWDDEEASNILNELKSKSWIPGGGWARHFVSTLGFPLKLAGISSEKLPEAKEEVQRRIDLKDLKPFQQNLSNQLLQTMLNRNGLENRAILQLPTGSGKTRTAAEAVIELWKQRTENTRWILWIAQTEELCEQAFQCYRQIWEEKGDEGTTLNMYRVWGGRSLPDPTEEGIIISGIDQLAEFILDEDDNDKDAYREDELSRLQNGLGIVLIDEAHHAYASSYNKVLRSLGMTRYPKDLEQPALIGLTATPFRTSEEETKSLLKKFGGKILWPNPKFEPNEGFDDSWRDWDFIKDLLRKQKILSKPIYHYLKTDSVFEMDQKETEDLRIKKLLGDKLMERIGNDKKRNIEVYREIKKWVDKGRTVLFFGANVNQAILMSKFLNENKIKSAVITSDTRYGTRQNYVKMFKDGQIQVLCNYQVLTTGFDAPKIDTIIIARPTGSRNLYEQMIGRGLRGPEFGGTEECDIVTVLDNILTHERKRIKLGHEEYEETEKEEIIPEEKEKIIEAQKMYQQEEYGRLPEPKIPVSDAIFTEEELYERFRVQTSGGIRFTKKHDTVLLIDADSSHYNDHVDEKRGVIIYVGTGEGDQTFDRGVGMFNTKIRDSQNSTLLYFHKPERNKIIFRFPVRYISHDFANEPDATGKIRRVIKFKLEIIRAKCPVCKKIASTETQVDELFGFREINGTERVQSWCKDCR